MNGVLFLSSLALFAAHLVSGDGHDDSHDHDSHDHEHDDEHDVHSCHYGYIPDVDMPIVEDECVYVGSNSYIFECTGDTTGTVETFNGKTDCSGTASSTMTIDSSMYGLDCTSTSECDVYEVTIDTYDNSTDCMGMTPDSTTYIVLTTGANGECIRIGNEGAVTIDITANKWMESGYSSTDCSTTPITSELNTGCQEFAGDGLFVTIELEVEEDDDSSANAIMPFKIALFLFALVASLFV